MTARPCSTTPSLDERPRPMKRQEKQKLLEEIYTHFFASNATTEKKRDLYRMWSRMVYDWATTTQSEHLILKKYGYSIASEKSKKSYRNPRLHNILKECQTKDSALYQKCADLRQHLKDEKRLKALSEKTQTGDPERLFSNVN